MVRSGAKDFKNLKKMRGELGWRGYVRTKQNQRRKQKGRSALKQPIANLKV
jgi:hypothetical protein